MPASWSFVFPMKPPLHLTATDSRTGSVRGLFFRRPMKYKLFASAKRTKTPPNVQTMVAPVGKSQVSDK